MLNAFRHHRNSHVGEQAVKEADREVLNAFRHHRNSHPRNCLLPFRKTCAQRLSASSEFSRVSLGTMACSTMVLNAFRHHRNSHTSPRQLQASQSKCSTPFGIIGILTGCGGGGGLAARVLNAFRHHRNSHRYWSLHFSQMNLCAQRLSASSEFSPRCRPIAGPCQLVLNAFRHHRNSHGHRC